MVLTSNYALTVAINDSRNYYFPAMLANFKEMVSSLFERMHDMFVALPNDTRPSKRVEIQEATYFYEVSAKKILHFHAYIRLQHYEYLSLSSKLVKQVLEENKRPYQFHVHCWFLKTKVDVDKWNYYIRKDKEESVKAEEERNQEAYAKAIALVEPEEGSTDPSN